MQHVITCVHGTFAWRARWTREDSKLSQRLIETLGADCKIVPFRWSALNALWARSRAAERLRAHIQAVAAQYPCASHYILGHSHGGSIAMYALRDPKVEHMVRGIVCMSTPFLVAEPRRFGPIGEGSLALMLGAPLPFIYFVFFLVRSVWWDQHPILGFISIALLTCVGWVVGSLLIDAWIAVAKRHCEALRLPTPTAPILLIRTTGDEASAFIVFFQIVTWFVNRAFGFLLTVTSMIVFLLGSAIWLWIRYIPVNFLRLLGVLGALAALPFVLAAFSALGALAAALTVSMSILLFFPLGFQLGLTYLFLEVNVEATPPGTWTIYHDPSNAEWPLQMQPDEATGEYTASAPVAFLAHSRPYDSDAVCELVANWIMRCDSPRA